MALLNISKTLRFPVIPFLSRGKKYMTSLDTLQKRLDFYEKADEFDQRCTPLKQFSADQSHVSLNLAKHVISSEARRRNFVFSPLSVHAVLGVIAAGSTGRTREEVLRYLKAKSSEEFNSSMSQVASIMFADGSSLGGPCLSYVNGVWVDHRFPLKERFKKILDDVYNGVTEQVDFKNQAETERKKLNSWANEKSNGLIEEVFPPGSIHALTRLVFGNAVYFKGAWDGIFTKSRTKIYDFFLSNGETVKVPFMTNSEEQRVSAFEGFKVLGMGFRQGQDVRNFSMYTFLPDSKDGLPSLVEKVTAEPGFLERHLPHKFVTVRDFRIPKFKTCFEFDANNVLKEFGLVSAFSGGLTEMADEDVPVFGILHKSIIEVNEEGAEAAAVTSGICSYGYMSRPVKKKINFVADRPFMFVIREDTTGMLLFVGHVLNPLST